MLNEPRLKKSLDLSTEYKYDERGIIVPDLRLLQSALPINLKDGKLQEGAKILNNAMGNSYYKRSLISSGIESIKYDIFVLSMLPEQKAYAAITSLKGEGDSLTIIGLRDFTVKYGRDYITSTGSGNILSHLTPISVDKIVKKMLYPELRESEELLGEDLPHSFVILPDFRGKDYGKHLFFTALELASLLGSELHYLTQDGTLDKKEVGKSYYDKYTENGQFVLRS